MNYVSENIKQNRLDKNKYKSNFVPAGQTTQLIIGATPESDLKILKLSENLYHKLSLNFESLKKLGVTLKRAKYFITCKGKYFDKVYKFNSSFIETNLVYQEKLSMPNKSYKQLSLFDNLQSSNFQFSSFQSEKQKLLLFNKIQPSKEDKIKCLTGNL